MTGTPVIKKVPGNLVKFNQERDGYVDFDKLSKTELLDLNQREEKLLNNGKFLDKLPDKGEKIKKFCERIQVELKKRSEHDKLCGLLANLNVNESKEKIDKLEWTGKYDPDSPPVETNEEDEVNPLKILATHSGTSTSREKQVKEKKEETLVKAFDVRGNDDTALNIVENYAKELFDRLDSVKKEPKYRFYTHKLLNTTSVNKIVEGDEPKIVSSKSTVIHDSKAKLLSLQESVVVHQQQMKHLKEVEMRHAMEKLTNKTTCSMNVPVENISEYREQIVDSDDEISDVTKAEDEDENDTAIYYNLVD